MNFVFVCGPTAGDYVASMLRFLDHTQLDTHTADRPPLNERSACHRGCCLHNIQQTWDEQSCHQWDSNPQPQQTCGRRPTPSVAQPQRSVVILNYWPLCSINEITNVFLIPVVHLKKIMLTEVLRGPWRHWQNILLKKCLWG